MVLLFTVRSVGKVQRLLGETSRTRICVRLPPSLSWICTSSADSIRKGSAESDDHVGNFFLNCVDDDLMDFTDPQRRRDIHRVEHIIIHRLLGDILKKQRD